MKIEPVVRWIRHPNRMDPGLLFMLSLVVTSLLFHGTSLIIGGDYGGVAFHPWELAGEYLSSWNFSTDTGNTLPQVISNQVPPVDLLFYLGGSALGLSTMATEWAYAVFLSYFLGACATYFLARTLFKGRASSARLAALVAGSFYVLNPIYVYASGAQSVLGSSIPRSALPLALFLLIAGLKGRDIRYAFALGLTSVLLLAVFARAMEIAYFLVISALLGLPYVPRLWHHREAIGFAARFVTTAAVTGSLVNLFWIVPFFGNYGVFLRQLSSYPTSFVAFESQFTTPANVFRLQGFWTLFVGNYVSYASFYEEPAVIAVTFVLPILVILPLGWRREWDPATLSLAFLLVLFLGLSLGTNLPFGLYQGLVSEVPFFKLFKDPWVFLEPLSLVYAILLGLSFDHIALLVKNRTTRPLLAKVVCLGMALALLGTISAPVLTGAAVVNWYQPSQQGVTVPREYQELQTWLDGQHCDCATLLLPELSGPYVATRWGYQGANTIYRNLLPGRLITGAGSPVYGLQNAQAKLFTQYAYDLLSNGDPLHSPIPLNGTQNLTRWSASLQGEPSSDSTSTTNLQTPWNDTVVEWRISAAPGAPITGHTLTFFPGSAIDLSSQAWLDVWVSSSFKESGLYAEIQDQYGQTAWYSVASHVLRQNAAWSLVALPIMTPDGGAYNTSLVSKITLETVVPTDGSPAAMGNATVLVGAFRLSTGTVFPALARLLLRSLNVGFVVLDASVNESFYPALDPAPYRLRLAQLSNLRLLRQFGNLTVYATDDAGSLVSVPSAWIETVSFYDLNSELKDNPVNEMAEGFITGSALPGRTVFANASLLSAARERPTEFAVRVDARGGFLLTLATTYDSNWTATIDGNPAGVHTLANGYANGWLLNITGVVTIDIHFGGQLPFDAAIVISASTLVVSSVLAAFETRKLRKVPKKVLQFIRSWTR